METRRAYDPVSDVEERVQPDSAAVPHPDAAVAAPVAEVLQNVVGDLDRAVAGRRTMDDLTIAEPIAADAIRSRILTIRGVQVMLDRDLASLYGVEVGQLNRQVKRNPERFPSDFMFQLSREDCSRCQIGTLNGGRGSNIKYLPYAFTENGIAMLSSVLRSPRAIAANIQVMRAFNAMRRALASLAPLLSRIEATERRQLKQEDAQARNEERFKLILDAMQDKKFPPQKVFFDGQIYDAFEHPSTTSARSASAAAEAPADKSPSHPSTSPTSPTSSPSCNPPCASSFRSSRPSTTASSADMRYCINQAVSISFDPSFPLGTKPNPISD